MRRAPTSGFAGRPFRAWQAAHSSQSRARPSRSACARLTQTASQRRARPNTGQAPWARPCRRRAPCLQPQSCAAPRPRRTMQTRPRLRARRSEACSHQASARTLRCTGAPKRWVRAREVRRSLAAGTQPRPPRLPRARRRPAEHTSRAAQLSAFGAGDSRLAPWLWAPLLFKMTPAAVGRGRRGVLQLATCERRRARKMARTLVSAPRRQVCSDPTTWPATRRE